MNDQRLPLRGSDKRNAWGFVKRGMGFGKTKTQRSTATTEGWIETGSNPDFFPPKDGIQQTIEMDIVFSSRSRDIEEAPKPTQNTNNAKLSSFYTAHRDQSTQPLHRAKQTAQDAKQ